MRSKNAHSSRPIILKRFDGHKFLSLISVALITFTILSFLKPPIQEILSSAERKVARDLAEIESMRSDAYLVSMKAGNRLYNDHRFHEALYEFSLAGKNKKYDREAIIGYMKSLYSICGYHGQYCNLLEGLKESYISSRVLSKAELYSLELYAMNQLCYLDL